MLHSGPLEQVNSASSSRSSARPILTTRSAGSQRVNRRCEFCASALGSKDAGASPLGHQQSRGQSLPGTRVSHTFHQWLAEGVRNAGLNYGLNGENGHPIPDELPAEQDGCANMDEVFLGRRTWVAPVWRGENSPTPNGRWPCSRQAPRRSTRRLQRCHLSPPLAGGRLSGPERFRSLQGPSHLIAVARGQLENAGRRS